MATVAEYTNRKVDLLAYQGQKAAGEALLASSLAIPGGSGQLCTGIQKLAQRFLLELFTETGSMFFQPNRGCVFMTLARQGKLRTIVDVRAAFSAAVIDIYKILTSEETTDMPKDEKFKTATLLAVATSPGFISITVRVVSQAGLARQVVMPINTTTWRK